MSSQIASELLCIHIWVKGHVQGVGFRAFVQQSGVECGLKGWVRNVGYDTVETLACGPRDKLEEFAIMVKTGPRAGRVNEARVEWEATREIFLHFGVKNSL